MSIDFDEFTDEERQEAAQMLEEAINQLPATIPPRPIDVLEVMVDYLTVEKSQWKSRQIQAAKHGDQTASVVAMVTSHAIGAALEMLVHIAQGKHPRDMEAASIKAIEHIKGGQKSTRELSQESSAGWDRVQWHKDQGNPNKYMQEIHNALNARKARGAQGN